ncbi:glycosyltransferase family 1 protein [Neobacillus massiliamazoniensis]|uniref:Group 1 glycosyl transferase n=1 Tax=Neobacillus massiliamazoniensis TaxID=1499688 RepID=A0A0U1NUH9_9BACI|nr:glycosyltransferase family 1 protein [Neobacillus massiliamazoniensis]CRK81673.1 group 1 glycosyl transferase [Neobacillus massiliamazoniensis]
MDKKSNLKRVLHIVSTMDRGGAETLIMNIYRNIDKTKIQFDFVSHSSKKGDYDDEIISLGGKIHYIPSLGELGPIKYIKELKRVMSSAHYIAVHSHTDFQSGFPALAAKLCGIKKRICHSHSTNWPKNNHMINKFILKFLQILIKVSATNYCSCSNEAAAFLFSQKLVDHGKVKILNNGIDLNSFFETYDGRDHLLSELGLPKDVKIIGHVGRFSKSKNQSFILKILKKILETDPNYFVCLVGDGPLKKQVEREAEALGVLNHIKFLGVRTDIPRLMKAFDVFLFPSLFEGFGIVTLEAQCAGTPCVASAAVPRSTDMGLGLITYISLEEDLNTWSKYINKAAFSNRPDNETIKKHFKNKGFSMEENVPKWLSLYLNDKQESLSHLLDLIRS